MIHKYNVTLCLMTNYSELMTFVLNTTEGTQIFVVLCTYNYFNLTGSITANTFRIEGHHSGLITIEVSRVADTD